ncbi:hypothetical protein SVAN01_08140 [Stagonosporopsis vannaccii]|nr:hypothetical protein SVAN01_08140 [Stagonosporopsis vannaccii]
MINRMPEAAAHNATLGILNSPAEDCPLHDGIRNLTRPEHEREPGWPLLAKKMADVPEFAAFSRFRELNVKNLLYYQAELKVVEDQLLTHEEHTNTDTTCYEDLAENANSCYHRLMMTNRKLLREYNQALLDFTSVSTLPNPDALNMKTLCTWLKDCSSKEQNIHDRYGLDRTWGDLGQKELSKSLWPHFLEVFWALILAKAPPPSDASLVVTQPNAKVDGLTKWIGYHLVPLWWEIKDAWVTQQAKSSTSDVEKTQNGSHSIGGIKSNATPTAKTYDTLESISEHTALRFTSGLTTVVACLVPVVAIAVLTQVSSTRDLLLCITGFAVIFAIVLMFVTQGSSSRTEIFAATAAFSAVLVVFISQPVINIQMPQGTQPPVINL